MSAQIINIRDYQRKEEKQPTLQQLESEIAVALFGFVPDTTIYESSIGYVAPEKDPA